ncbi:MAG: hypothetical protein K2H09_02610, partial [Treponemataceae bacterium]|nr:hypothetical protein [Treponemataceae bacterium]
MMWKRFVCVVSLVSIFSHAFPCLAETAEPYAEDEFPSFMKDLRRAEIITLGAMPFVTLNVSLCYSLGKFAAHDFDTAYFANPFAQTDSSAYTTGEQAGIILTSLGISLGIGLTDFIVHAVKRSSAKKRMQSQQNQSVKITPVTEDSDAVR